MSAQIEIKLIKDPVEKKKIINRLKRAQGQLGAVIKALEEDQPCRTVMQQVSAVSKAVDRAGYLIIAGTLRECLISNDNDAQDRVDEIQKMFLSLA